MVGWLVVWSYGFLFFLCLVEWLVWFFVVVWIVPCLFGCLDDWMLVCFLLLVAYVLGLFFLWMVFDWLVGWLLGLKLVVCLVVCLAV